jgi:toxin YoeB
MKLHFTERGWIDYLFWQESDQQVLRRLNALLKEIERSPFVGLGKPEPLRGEFSGWWSRRITREDRLVYRVAGQGDGQRLEILSCRYHYER